MQGNGSQKRNDPTEDLEFLRLRILIIRLLKGMILLAVCLLLSWIAFERVTAAPAFAAGAVLLFLIYALRIWWQWQHEPPEGIKVTPLVDIKRNIRAIQEERIESQRTPEPELPLPEIVVYRAHWAFFVKLAYKPFLIFMAVLIFMISGIQNRWELMAYPEAVPAMVILLAGMFLWILYAFFDWIHDLYIVEPDSIKDVSQKPFAQKDINIAMVGKIQSVRFVKRGIVQLLLNYGTLNIVVGESELSFDYVPQPEKVQNLILARIDDYTQRERQAEADKQQHFVSELITALKQNATKTE